MRDHSPAPAHVHCASSVIPARGTWQQIPSHVLAFFTMPTARFKTRFPFGLCISMKQFHWLHGVLFSGCCSWQHKSPHASLRVENAIGTPSGIQHGIIAPTHQCLLDDFLLHQPWVVLLEPLKKCLGAPVEQVRAGRILLVEGLQTQQQLIRIQFMMRPRW